MSRTDRSASERFDREIAGASLRGDHGRAALALAIMELADAIRQTDRPLARLFQQARESEDP